jgi:hypothetical protein
MMTDDYVECSQVSGKTIQSLRIYKDTGDGTELQIDLTDGTSFMCSFSVRPIGGERHTRRFRRARGPAQVRP